MGVGRIVLVGAEKVEKAFWGAQLLKETVSRPLLLDGLMQAGTTALPVLRVEKNFRRYLEGGRFEVDFAGQTRRVVAHPYAGTGIRRAWRRVSSSRSVPRAGGRTTRWRFWRRMASRASPLVRASSVRTRRPSPSSRALCPFRADRWRGSHGALAS